MLFLNILLNYIYCEYLKLIANLYRHLKKNKSKQMNERWQI